MSFSIKKSHKYANPVSSVPTTQTQSLSSIGDELSSEDYALFNLKGKNVSVAKSGQTPTHPKKGGQSIRSVPNAQSDYY